MRKIVLKYLDGDDSVKHKLTTEELRWCKRQKGGRKKAEKPAEDAEKPTPKKPSK
jgi:hypothetical protein